MHACCAPCASASSAYLVGKGETPYMYFDNPNIHPYTEFKNRLDSFRAFLVKSGLPGEAFENYGLREYLTSIQVAVKPERCLRCYEMRLDAAARRCRELGFVGFTTTLTISPYQDHDLIKLAGEKAARKNAVGFEYYDFRPLYRESRQMSREAGYYMQKYCGCIFSEEERYCLPAGGGLR